MRHPTPELAETIAELVKTTMSDIRPRLVQAALTGHRAENENLRHEDNFLSDYDLWMHQRYKELLSEVLPSFIYASEEDDPQVIGEDPDPDLCVLVDPLDTSELAVRALHGYTHLMLYSRSLRRPVIAIVGDIFHHVQLYLAFHDNDGSDRAFLITADGDRHALESPSNARLSQALVTNYLMRPAERFRALGAAGTFPRRAQRTGREREGARGGSVSTSAPSACATSRPASPTPPWRSPRASPCGTCPRALHPARRRRRHHRP